MEGSTSQINQTPFVSQLGEWVCSVVQYDLSTPWDGDDSSVIGYALNGRYAELAEYFKSNPTALASHPTPAEKTECQKLIQFLQQYPNMSIDAAQAKLKSFYRDAVRGDGCWGDVIDVLQGREDTVFERCRWWVELLVYKWRRCPISDDPMQSNDVKWNAVMFSRVCNAYAHSRQGTARSRADPSLEQIVVSVNAA